MVCPTRQSTHALRARPGPEQARRVAHFIAGGQSTMSHVVLVVDDDTDVLDVVTSMLQELGCEVVGAQNGAEA
ncbi:MAG TPA: hypothetical protein VIN06_09670, partial [Devosia sp.]